MARKRIGTRHHGAEELGGIYEGLLELHPRIDPVERTFTLAGGAGNERKTTGSYYTPSSLIDLVLDNALDPLLDRATRIGSTSEQETALLALRICDPACGSGHFLVAAARRIANRLARLRSGETEPSLVEAQTALHDVVARCIYGVDVNPMAAELAKVSLWLEAIQPGRPLDFLDAHIKVGNSLLGTTPALLAAGIPDGAYAPITGDDRETVAEWRKRNAVERDRTDQLSFLEHRGAAFTNTLLIDQTRALATMPTLSLDDVSLRRRRYEQLRQSPELRRLKTAADTWAAAFFQNKTRANPVPITTETVRNLQTGQPVPAETVAAIEAIAGANRFFHWHIEYPDIFQVRDEPGSETDPDAGWVGGFDAVIGNPPWERVKLQGKEFFAERDPAIASAPTKAARADLIKALRANDRSLSAQFEAAKRDSEAESQFARTSGRYPLTGRGDVNAYAIFAETFRTLINADGRAGVLTPTGLATDATTAPFIADTLRSRRLAAFYDFENRKPLFAGVDSRFRFASVTLAGRGGIDGAVPLAFMLHDPADASSRSFNLTPAEILLLNPNTGTLPVFASRRDADITLGIYRRHPVLIRDGDPHGNPWGLSFSTMFHMSNDSHKFRTAADLTELGAVFDGWAWTGTDDAGASRRWLPLYEAKQLGIYDHRMANVVKSATATIRQNQPDPLTDIDHDDPRREAIGLYWVQERHIIEKFGPENDRSALFGWRKITSSTNERTLLSAVVPRAAAGDSLLMAFPGMTSRQPMFQALTASLAFDFVARQKLSGVNFQYFVFKQLPAPIPTTFDVAPPWSPEPLRDWILPRVLELTYTSYRMAPYARDMGDTGQPFRWIPERRALIQAELDAAMLHVYGLSRGEAEHVLDSFPVLRKYEERDHGEFRTRRLVLDFYDQMARAAATGIPYQTPITPPPGHGPRHEPRTHVQGSVR